MKTISYLAFDITDAQVHRRIMLFRRMGAEVNLIGFRRSSGPPPADTRVVDLGETKNGALVRRMLSVLKAIVRPGEYRELLRSADVIVARNLEMLLIAHAVIRGMRRRPRLIYESLDIHRMLSGKSAFNKLMRRIERRSMRRCDLLITSSPRFIVEHFEREAKLAIPHIIVENKVPAFLGDHAIAPRAPLAGPPWVIGWFGRLRCRKSLHMLRDIAARSSGRIAVVIAGQVSYNEMPEFDAVIEESPGLTFLGAYRMADLPRIYGMVHFAWCIDFMEAGENSDWLLPNRIYESCAHGAVPIALARVETGAWLARTGVGILVDASTADIEAKLAALDAERYAALLAEVQAIPRQALFLEREEAERVFAAVVGEG